MFSEHEKETKSLMKHCSNSCKPGKEGIENLCKAQDVGLKRIVNAWKKIPTTPPPVC